MKTLKNSLKEAIDIEFAEKKLRPWSNKVSGVSGPTLEYIKTLEAILSYLSPTSAKTNAKFDKFLADHQRRQKSAERMAQPEERPGDFPEPEDMEKIEKGEEPEPKGDLKSILPDDEPDASALFDEPGPSKAKSIPSLKSLAKRETEPKAPKASEPMAALSPQDKAPELKKLKSLVGKPKKTGKK
jgi:hypothetical protein